MDAINHIKLHKKTFPKLEKCCWRWTKVVSNPFQSLGSQLLTQLWPKNVASVLKLTPQVMKWSTRASKTYPRMSINKHAWIIVWFFPNVRKFVLAAGGVRSGSASEYHNKSTKVSKEGFQKRPDWNRNPTKRFPKYPKKWHPSGYTGALQGGDRPHKGVLHSRWGLVPAMGESDDRKVTWTQWPVYIYVYIYMYIYRYMCILSWWRIVFIVLCWTMNWYLLLA